MDTAYTSRKMWFGLKFILTESPIQKSFFTRSSRLVFEPELVKSHIFHTYFVFSCLIFCSLAYFMISLTEHCVYCKLNCTLEKEIKKSKFVVMETLVHTRKIKW